MSGYERSQHVTEPNPLKNYGGLSVGVAAACFAAPLIRLAKAPAISIATYRLGIASFVFLPMTIFTLMKNRINAMKDWIQVFIASTFLASHFAFWITSLEHTSIGSSTFIVTCNPVLVVVISKLFFKERITRKQALGIGLGLMGITTITILDQGSGIRDIVGDVLAFLGACAIAGYYLSGRDLRSRLPTLIYVAPLYLITALELLSVSLVTNTSLSGYNLETYRYLLLLSLGPQLLGHSLFNWSLGHFSAVKVSTAVMLEPIGATLIGWLLLHEAPTLGVLMGGPFIILGVSLVL